MKGILIAVGAILVVLLVWFLFAWGGDSMEDTLNQDDEQATTTNSNGNFTNNDGEDNAPYVLLDENDEGDTVIVSSASLEEDGFIVLYRTDATSGQVEQIAVSGLLEAGVYVNEPVFSDVTVSEGDSVAAVLYVDDGDGVFSAEDDTFATTAETRMVGDIDVIGVPVSEEAAELLEQAEDILERELEVESETETEADATVE